MKKILKPQKDLLITGLIAILLSIIGMIIFHKTGLYLIYPIIYVFILIGGIGWLVTGLVSIKNNKE